MSPIHLREISSDGVILSGDVAAELYAARLQRGIDLSEISAELRIHYDHLLALEEGRFSDLPGPTYVIGFLRSYASYLDLDADVLVQRFKTETTEFEPRQDLKALEPFDEGGVPTGALIVLALALVVGAYGGWYYVTNLDVVAVERVPEVPQRLVAVLAPEPVATPEPETLAVTPPAAPEPVIAAPMAAAPEPETPALEASPPEPAVVLSEEPFEAMLAAAIEQSTDVETTPEPAIEAAPLPEPVSPAPASPEPVLAEPLETAALQPVIPAPVIESADYRPREYGQANSDSTITLRALEESWVQVTGRNNELLLTRILRPGDVYHVPNRSGLMLMTGNAGGIEILVGDKLAPSLGEIGKVRRQVLLDPEKLLAGTAGDP